MKRSLATVALAAVLAAQPEGEIVPLERRIVPLEGEIVDLSREVVTFEGDRDLLTVEEAPEQVELRLAADVFFPFGEATLTPDATRLLDEIVPRLRDQATAPVAVEGHTDAIDDDAFNQRLSEQRAEAVRSYLAAAVPGLAFDVRGFGETQPIAPNTNPDGSDNPEGRSQNRRVAIRYAPRPDQ